MKKHLKTSSAAAVIILSIYIGFVILYERHIHEEAHHNIKKHARVIANALWNLNPQGATEYLSLACESQNYKHVTVKDLENETFHSAERSISRAEKIFLSLGLIPTVTLQSDIVYNSKTIGYIDALWMSDTIYLELTVLFVFVLFYLIIQLYAGILFSKQVLEERVARRTRELSELNTSLKNKVDENQRARKALKESEDKYRSIVNHAPAGIYEFDMETLKFISVNDVMCEYTGYSEEEFLNMDPFQLLSEDSRQVLNDLIETVFTKHPQEIASEYKLKGKNQKEFQVLVNARFFYENNVPQKAMAVVHDLTELRQAEEERRQLEIKLQQAQKMEAIGTLAGGIAHDFNNILAGILGYCELLESTDGLPEKTEDQIKQIHKGASRAAELVRQILTFSRNVNYEKKSLEPALIVTEVLKFVRSSIPATIEICQEISSTSKVFADPVKLHQVIMNLCTNAYHAMDDTGGTLTISMTDTELSGAQAAKLQMPPGNYVLIEVQDTGRGMDTRTLERIFEPYFTTKEIGKGTGLGLSMVYAIIKEHRGTISVTSRQGSGSSFKIFLPATQTDDPHETWKIENPHAPLSGCERIMIVDDEQSILLSTAELLMDQGYTVETYAEGTRALEEFKKAPEKVDLVITDMTMPGITGDMLAREMIQVRSDLPVILCSGYSEKLSKERAFDIGIKRFIQKPLIDQPMTRIVRDVLDELQANID